MIEGFTEFSIEDAYAELRRILLDMKCQPLWTIPPEAIEVRQGSWLGMSPVTMAKNLRFRLYPKNQGTRITSSAYWPMALSASFIALYSACFFLLSIIAYITIQMTSMPLINSPFGLFIIVLFGIVIILVLLHTYSYIKRSKALHKILNLLSARGSSLHRRIQEARLRKSRSK